MKALKSLVPLLVILLINPLPPLKAQPQPPQAPPQEAPPGPGGGVQLTQQDLQQYVNELSRELPMTLESSIRWDSIALAQGRMLIYKYTFLDPAVQRINPQQTEQIRRSVAETMCQNQDVKILLDNDVKFNFKYHARQGKFLTEVFFNRSDCG